MTHVPPIVRSSGMSLPDRDLSVRVQDDLFRHANGHWLDTAEIPADRARYGSFDVLRDASERDCHAIVEELSAAGGRGEPLLPARRKVADLYASFMDESAVEAAGVGPLAGFLADVDDLTDVAGIPPLLGRWLRAGIDGPVGLIVWTDSGDSERTIAHLEQAGLGLPDEAYYREDSYAEVRAAYVGHVERMLALAGDADASTAAADVMMVETSLAAHHWDNVTNRDPIKTYNKWTWAELHERAPGIDWAAWIDALGAPVGSFDELVVRQPSFVEALPAAYADHTVGQWQAWLRWHLIHRMAPFLSAAFVEENFAFYGKTLSGRPQLRQRWKRGVGLVEVTLGEALGEVYVERHFPPAATSRMTELVANLVEAFRRDFTTLAWMSPETREQALSKLEAFRPKIGHPERWRDYSALAIDRADLVGNVRSASGFDLDRNLAKIAVPVDRDEWFMTPQTINAYYNPGMNEIVFPAAILQPPFFDVDADDAVNYGGIGAVIGHEIGHGFDDSGSRYDGSGNLRDWWTEQDRERFDAKADALRAQFDALEPRDAPGHHVNGALTVGENIGDLGGLTIGHAAYRISCETEPAPVLEGLTGDQRFFLGWAQVWKGRSRREEAIRLLAIDPHSPQDARGNIARNLHEFHEAFGVVEGDGMWLDPDERVRIF
ncbi:MAG: M13-type metalloendopeptidase [Nostocoides sp.]